MGGGISRTRKKATEGVGHRRRLVHPPTSDGPEAVGPIHGGPPGDDLGQLVGAQTTEPWRARFQVANGMPPSPGSAVTIRLGPVLGVVVDGREIGTLVGNHAQFVAGYMRQGYTFSGEISAFDRKIREGEVALVGTAPDEA
jgi:hypothetical protein